MQIVEDRVLREKKAIKIEIVKEIFRTAPFSLPRIAFSL